MKSIITYLCQLQTIKIEKKCKLVQYSSKNIILTNLSMKNITDTFEYAESRDILFNKIVWGIG